MGSRLQIASWAADIDNNGIIWLSHFGINGAFCYDISTGEMHYIGYFEDMRMDQGQMHSYAKCVREYVYYVPLRDKYLRRINRRTMEIESISIKDVTNHRPGKIAIGDDQLFYITFEGDAFISDISELSFKYDSFLSGVTKEFKQSLSLVNNPKSLHTKGVFSASFQEGMLLLWYRDKLCMIDINDRKVVNVDLKDDSTYQVFINGNEIWINHAFDLDIACLNMADMGYVKYSGEYVKWKPVSEKDQALPYSRLCISGDNVWVLNYRTNHIYRINRDDRYLEEAFPDTNINRRTSWSCGGLNPDYYNALIYNSKVFFIPCGMRSLIEYDTVDQDITFRDFCIDMGEIASIDQYSIKRLQQDIYMEKGEPFGLNAFISWVKDVGIKGEISK